MSPLSRRAARTMPDSATPPHLPLIAALVDELARSGVRHAVLCPGSRNAPVLLALENDARIETWPVLDERAAGFMALGLAKATGAPVAVCVTSGTAVSNLLPAATEAHEAGVPLLLLTADRPPELRDVGAGQTIDQLRALDHVTRWTVELEMGDASGERERWVRATTCRALAACEGAAGGRPGPVQLNVPLRKPLTAPGRHLPLLEGRAGGAPWLTVHRAPGGPERGIFDDLVRTLLTTPRGVIVAGRAERSPALATLLPRLAAALGWPLLADPMSGARRGDHAIAGYDLLLQAPPAELTPQLVLRAGDLPVSQPLRDWLAGPAAASPQLILTPEAVWSDPASVAGQWLTGDPATIIAGLLTAVGAAREHESVAAAADPAWIAAWRAAQQQATESTMLAAGASPLDPQQPLTERLVAHLLATTLGPGDTLVVGASLPIRMLERWAPASDGPPRVLSNRGANGIDGVVSTAFGVAAAQARGGAGRTVAHLGDLTLLYDQGGLAQARLALAVQLVVVDNGGGRIFDRLPVASDAAAADFERVIRTPHVTDLAQLAAAHGLDYESLTTAGELLEALDLPSDRARLLHVRASAD